MERKWKDSGRKCFLIILRLYLFFWDPHEILMLREGRSDPFTCFCCISGSPTLHILLSSNSPFSSGCLMWEVRGRRGRNGSTALRTWPPLSSVWLWVDTTRCSMKTRPRWALNTHSHAQACVHTQTCTSVLMLWHTQTHEQLHMHCASYTLCAHLTN